MFAYVCVCVLWFWLCRCRRCRHRRCHDRLLLLLALILTCLFFVFFGDLRGSLFIVCLFDIWYFALFYVLLLVYDNEWCIDGCVNVCVWVFFPSVIGCIEAHFFGLFAPGIDIVQCQFIHACRALHFDTLCATHTVNLIHIEIKSITVLTVHLLVSKINFMCHMEMLCTHVSVPLVPTLQRVQNSNKCTQT